MRPSSCPFPAVCRRRRRVAPLAGAQAAEPITIMVGGINKIIYLPAKLAEALGYFKDEGLTVELQSQPAGVDAENQLIAGAVQAVVGFYDHTIDLQSKGKELEAIAVFCKVPGEVELVSTKAAPSFKTMADAKGKTLGVTGLGSSTDFLTRYLADRQGVASKDYTLLPVGAGNTFIAAIKQDRIQAGMTTEPTVSELLKTGEAKVLVDLRTEEGSKAALGGLYPAASLYVQNAWADSHKAEATKLARAFARTMAWIHTHSAEEIAEKMPKDYYGADKALYVSALKASLPMYTTDGRMPAGGRRRC
jgi:NitT/TauT family transport system substrate-binding protein